MYRLSGLLLPSCFQAPLHAVDWKYACIDSALHAAAACQQCLLICVLVRSQVTPGEVMPIYSDREFDHVLKKHDDQLVVVCASSSDCVPCRGFEPVYEVCLCTRACCRSSCAVHTCRLLIKLLVLDHMLRTSLCMLFGAMTA